MLHKNYALDLYQTKTKGTGTLRATKLHQALCNRVKGDQVIQNQHAFSKRMDYRKLLSYKTERRSREEKVSQI